MVDDDDDDGIGKDKKDQIFCIQYAEKATEIFIHAAKIMRTQNKYNHTMNGRKIERNTAFINKNPIVEAEKNKKEKKMLKIKKIELTQSSYHIKSYARTHARMHNKWLHFMWIKYEWILT